MVELMNTKKESRNSRRLTEIRNWRYSLCPLEAIVLRFTKEWRSSHTEELQYFYSSPNNVRVIKSGRIRWAEYVARMGEWRGAYRVLVVRPEGKRPLGRHKLKWENNIKVGIQEVRWRRMDWIDLAQERERWRAVVNVVMNLPVP